MSSATPVSKLPFVTAPVQKTVKIGNERTGILEFPVYNDLTVQEAAWLQANAGAKTAFQHTSRLALKIARQEKVKPVESHAFVARVMAAAMGTPVEFNSREEEWTVRYVRELEECGMNVLETSIATQNNLVTCVIRHRLPGMEDWSPSDTTGLPSELCDEIYAFAISEQNRGTYDDIQEAQDDLAEMLGKLRTEPTKSPEESTGEPSTTSSESSTPETPTSPSTASAPSRRATPSKRSKKAAD